MLVRSQNISTVAGCPALSQIPFSIKFSFIHTARTPSVWNSQNHNPSTAPMSLALPSIRSSTSTVATRHPDYLPPCFISLHFLVSLSSRSQISPRGFVDEATILDKLRPSNMGRKNAASGRIEGMQAQTTAVLTSATL